LDSVKRHERTEYFVSLKVSVFRTEENNIMVNGKELVGTTGHMALQTRSADPSGEAV
jgi:hypothetical protein